MLDLKDLLQPVQENTILTIVEKRQSEIRDDDDFLKLRHSALQRLKVCPVPNTRDEFWKYTRIAPALKKHFQFPKTAPAAAIQSFDKGPRMVFVDGIYDPSLSRIPSGLQVENLNAAKSKSKKEILELLKNKQREDFFSLLTDSIYIHGPFVRVAPNTKIDEVLTIHHLITGKETFSALRGFFVLEEGAALKVIEQWTNLEAEGSFVSMNLDYIIADNASLEINKIQSVGAENNMVSQDFATLGRGAQARFNTITMEGAIIRNNLYVDLNGEGSVCHLNGLYMLKGKQHSDHHTIIKHAVPHCESHELYKGILNDSSRGVFNGKVMVMPHAQKTNAFQSNANILLTDDAQVYSKPELEIYADDVKCSHGSTTGQLDEDALFYLQARGLSTEGARNLLLYAFAKEVLEKLTIPSLKDSVDDYISKRYHADVND